MRDTYTVQLGQHPRQARQQSHASLEPPRAHKPAQAIPLQQSFLTVLQQLGQRHQPIHQLHYIAWPGTNQQGFGHGKGKRTAIRHPQILDRQVAQFVQLAPQSQGFGVGVFEPGNF